MAEQDAPETLASLRRGRVPRRRFAPSASSPSLFDLLAPVDEATTDDSTPAPLSSALDSPRLAEIAEAAVLPAPEPKRNPVLPAAASVRPPLPAEPDQTPPPVPETPPTWTVSGLVRHVRGFVERDYSRVTVEGEISNWRPSGSGHCYFTVKDAGAQLSAVMFRRQASLLRFQPRDGDAVKLHGQLSVYESRGQMQLIAEWMQQAGLGALLAEVQRLKEALRREGLFDRKRALPPFPRCIGVITSLQGAALRDIVKVCRRRHASVQLLIYPAAVQGPNCPAEIAAGLRWFNAHPDHAEVVLVARGGGSWEDLHGFDHEGVARAIAACSLPVITGIGHATDSTIADAAADVCAPTPSAAAELLTSAQHRVEEHVARLHGRLLRAGRFELLRAQGRFARLGAINVLRRAEDALNRRAQRLDELAFRAQSGLNQRFRSLANRLKAAEARLARQNPSLRLQEDRRRLEFLQARLARIGGSRLLASGRRLDAAQHRLQALSPLRVLERGYSLIYGPDGGLLRSADAVQPGAEIVARVARGTLRAQVLAIDPRPERASNEV